MQHIIKSGATSEQYIHENCFIAELINNAALPSCSLARARVLPGISTEVHAVQHTAEIYYVLSGKGRMFIDGAEQGIVGPGDVVMIPAGTSQSISNVGETDLEFLCFCAPRFEFRNYLPVG